MFQLQGAIIRPLYKNGSLSGFWKTIGIPNVHQKPDKDPFLYTGLMMAPCSRNMLPWWHVYILTIKWCARLNDSRIYKIRSTSGWLTLSKKSCCRLLDYDIVYSVGGSEGCGERVPPSSGLKWTKLWKWLVTQDRWRKGHGGEEWKQKPAMGSKVRPWIGLRKL